MAQSDETYQVLLVEDDPADAFHVRRCLKSAEPGRWILKDASTLQEAAAAVAEGGFDVILLDMNLPDAAAPDTLARGLEFAGDVPVIVLTGVEESDLGSSALQAGALDWLSKRELRPHMLHRALNHTVERARLRRLERQVYHADKLASIGKLAAGVAHEINNPATYVLMNQHAALLCLDKLIEEAEPTQLPLLEKAQQLLRHNTEGLQIIQSMTRGLSAFSRIEQDEVKLLDLNQVIEATSRLATNTLRHHARLVLDLEPLPMITGNYARLSQAILNLLTNATQAIPLGRAKEHRIRIHTWAEGGAVRLRIEDTGEGISPENLERIFEPFFTTRSREQGTGLGLTLVAETIRKHRGDIAVSSIVGQGTAIEVSIPKDNGLIAVEIVPPEPITADDAQVRVLLIDDEPRLTTAIEQTLDRNLFQITAVNTGAEAVEILKQRSDFDIILCDLMMPGVDGAAVYGSLDDEHSFLRERFVFMTAGAFTREMQAFVAARKNLVLQKPFASEFLARLLLHLGKRNRRDAE